MRVSARQTLLAGHELEVLKDPYDLLGRSSGGAVSRGAVGDPEIQVDDRETSDDENERSFHEYRILMGGVKTTVRFLRAILLEPGLLKWAQWLVVGYPWSSPWN